MAVNTTEIERKKIEFTVKGRIATKVEKSIALTVTAHIARRTVATAYVGKNGEINLPFEDIYPLRSPVELTIGPAKPMGGGSRIREKTLSIPPEQWKNPQSPVAEIGDVHIPEPIWPCWTTRDIVIHGIVCKKVPIPGTDMKKCCPVPYAEVEVFDVDPGFYYYSKAEGVVYSTLETVRSFPGISRTVWPAPALVLQGITYSFRKPVSQRRRYFANQLRGKASGLSVEAVARVVHDQVSADSIGSRLPKYSSSSLGKVYADKCGEFEIVISWPNCSLVDDDSPDLIFKVNQTVGTTTTTLYSEGYFNTRWDVPDELFVELDADPAALVACNPDCLPFVNQRAFFTGVGSQNIETHIIQPGNPANTNVGYVYNGSLVKCPFGDKLKIRGMFGSKILDYGKRYYRILYAAIANADATPAASDWKPVTEELADTSFYSEMVPGVGLKINQKTESLGPQTIPGSDKKEYYEIRWQKDSSNNDISWQDATKIAIFDTKKVANGMYKLKIEVVKPDGTQDPAVYYGDDTGAYVYMYLLVDNTLPEALIIEVDNNGTPINKDCGSFVHKVGEVVRLKIDAHHDNKHLLSWTMTYRVGYGSAAGTIAQDGTGTIEGDFEGKKAEYIAWTYFDEDLGWKAESDPLPEGRAVPPKPTTICSICGISVTLDVADKVIDGESLLGNIYGNPHRKVVQTGLAVSKTA
jgi:hypothetical protein